MIAELTVNQLLQLYAPLAGLLAVVFALGQLSNRVRTLERERAEDKTAADARISAAQGDHDTLVKVATQMEQAVTELGSVKRELGGVQRQLANLATSGAIKQFTQGPLHD